jgi:hypothetical protein
VKARICTTYMISRVHVDKGLRLHLEAQLEVFDQYMLSEEGIDDDAQSKTG